uniref:HMG1f n=1 Tax=Volvox carteri f. nagariensis TaxID=3068 RepID=D9CJ00_VOLCA|nr:HMG1f [Volvox carteri f. nagariensis]
MRQLEKDGSFDTYVRADRPAMFQSPVQKSGRRRRAAATDAAAAREDRQGAAMLPASQGAAPVPQGVGGALVGAAGMPMSSGTAAVMSPVSLGGRQGAAMLPASQGVGGALVGAAGMPMSSGTAAVMSPVSLGGRQGAAMLPASQGSHMAGVAMAGTAHLSVGQFLQLLVRGNAGGDGQLLAAIAAQPPGPQFTATGAPLRTSTVPLVEDRGLPKKPNNAFTEFCREMRAVPGQQGLQLAALSRLWASLPDNERKKYFDAYEVAKRVYDAQVPPPPSKKRKKGDGGGPKGG